MNSINFKLGEEQQTAIDKILSFINFSNDIAFSLTGSAGVGKTTIINILCDHFDFIGINYCLCAPTHKAALVMQSLTNRDTITLHKLLSLSPKIDILDLDYKDLKFKTSSVVSQIPFDGVVICDEASMISDDLFKLLIEQAQEFKSKIIFVSDKCQLSPVKSRNVSLVYNLQNSYNLEKIYRQASESALIDPLQTLRQNSIDRLKTCFGSNGSIICTSNIGEFLTFCRNGLKKAISDSNVLEAKILAFTNKRVELYNSKIRKLLWENDEQYNKFEFLTGYENLEYNSTNFFNSMDYIIISEPRKVDIRIPEFMSLPGYSFELYDSLNKTSDEVVILDRTLDFNYLNSLAHTIEDIRLSAINMSKTNKRQANKVWGIYYKVLNSFTTPIDLIIDNRVIRKKSFDYGYALTVHKSQSSSINNTFIDLKDINRCQDNEFRRQLQYVALSRTRINSYILQ